MEDNIYVQVAGLGIGEETKASTVEFLVKKLNAHTVLRSGGCQAGHHLVLEDGTDQMLSHFGCGTFEGAKTHLQNMVIDPVNLFSEALKLEEKGFEDPLSLITINEDCLSITPFHGALSRIKEKYREQKKGTVGMGVGDAIKDYKLNNTLGITASDFTLEFSQLKEKINNIRLRKLEQASRIVAESPWWDYKDGAEAEFVILEDEQLVDLVAESCQILSELVEIISSDQTRKILNQKGVIVGEPSHGALLHPNYGFLPHTTQIDPTGVDVLNNLKTMNYMGKVVRIGVSRCYMTRHGAGPLVSYSENLTNSIDETHNDFDRANEWLGAFRSGHYDLLAIDYAIEISGGRKEFDGLAISYLDKLKDFESWEVCTGYTFEGNYEANLEDFFEIENNVITRIKKSKKTGEQLNQHQLELTKLLNGCKPILMSLLPANNMSLEEVFINFIESKLDIPVVITGHGPKASDRKIIEKHAHVFEI